MRPVRTLARLLAAPLRDRRAATAIEYGLIAALIVIAMVAALRNLAGATTNMWTFVANEVLTRA